MTRRSYTSAGAQQSSDGSKPSFELDGVEFEAEGTISTMDLAEFARLATTGVDSGSAKGIAILADVYLSLLGEKTYERFREHCRKHGTDGGVLVEILGGMISEAADRPTSRPSDSSDGPPNDPGMQTVVSFKRATVEQKPKEPESPVVSYG
ncbi:hypothetical protein [Nonomuraea guangzhouensis]|uniref:Tail assembly chaperone n=1 Tax=Nonomuraea guangzhouensis TaxID=1291555 RepID=A0ABW4GXG1_9ACTN|nr:hypothetical protein [Nonomuraea guangzhouensis]